MILDFDDACWSHDDDDWRRSLVALLVILEDHEQHAVLANHEEMLQWCAEYLQLFEAYFKTRLAAAQPRAGSLTIRISPAGASDVTSPPPWGLNAEATRKIVGRPLRLLLENDSADKLFVEATVTRFSGWCTKGWIQPEMGGGSAMKAKIDTAAAHELERWRTFFMFDSDRLHPSEFDTGWKPPSGDGCQGHAFEVACASMPPRRWHRLQRRSIENYLPARVLTLIEPKATASLASTVVGGMAHYYNMKKGLAGDGVSPADPKKSIRAARSRGFWLSLPQNDRDALEAGFGGSISDEFGNVPHNHPWPADVLDEMNALADALQDAM
jgi:hypothetical protein